MKEFNITGTCFPDDHYMVDISRQVEDACKLARANKYFCINRGRQYGKTTTLSFIKRKLESEGFCVFSISLEDIDNERFDESKTLNAEFVKLLNETLIFNETRNITDDKKQIIAEAAQKNEIQSRELSLLIPRIAQGCKTVLIIDEVDQASNYISFVKFLGFLRDKYLQRKTRPTFHSVILAGVYDIKNLKLKMRPEEEHQYNSPWNIAVPFDTDMSLPADGIAKMLAEYKADHNIELNENEIATEIHNWTSGYPFLVSRICMLIESENLGWNREGVWNAAKMIISENNTLFDDLNKKIDELESLHELLRNILINGQKINYNPDNKAIDLGISFNLLAVENNITKVRNRLLETRLYDKFIDEDKFSKIYSQGASDKQQFIEDGYLNMEKVLAKFAEHFNSIYGPGDEQFIENQGRKMFLLYLRPIINGIGNYYIEAETRDRTRTDIVLDYRSRQYVIELKIWHGEEYNRKGEIQLSEYLDHFGISQGYMVSFSFNKNKKPGVKTIDFGNKKLIEAII